jgi:hypothetical protein
MLVRLLSQANPAAEETPKLTLLFVCVRCEPRYGRDICAAGGNGNGDWRGD